MKIYIIGPTGSGKSTLANILSKKMNIKNYELDLLVYDDEHDHIKRSDEEIEKLFHNSFDKTYSLSIDELICYEKNKIKIRLFRKIFIK